MRLVSTYTLTTTTVNTKQQHFIRLIMHRRHKASNVQYGEVESNGCRPFLEDANSSDDDDDLVDGIEATAAKGASNSASINFRRLDANESGIDDSQWAVGKAKTPWSVILFSAVLFLAGSVSIFTN